MIVSRVEISLCLLLAAHLCGCRTPAGAPLATAFHPSAHVSAPPPDAVDRTAAALARAALVGERADAERALQRMAALETVLEASEEPTTGIYDVSIDLSNTTLERRDYHRATDELLDRDDVDPALRARLEQFNAHDPLVLASDRVRDAVLLEVARAFNALAEPVGQSIMTAQMAPYRLGRSLVNYAMQVYSLEPLSLQRRQALVHWRNFLKRHPDAPEAEELEPRVQKANQKLLFTLRDRALRVAERAFELGRVRLALVYADRALRTVPEDQRAAELRDEAAERLIAIREDQQNSLEAGTSDLLHERPREARELALALLLPDGETAAAARRLREVSPEGPLADEARFAEATALGEAGDEQGMWEALDELADADPDESNMRRHARALTMSPERNTWRAFREARRHHRWERFKWVWLGPFFRGVPDRGLPGPLDWVVGAPSLAESIGGTPMRLINLPWAQQLPSERVTATTARRHLARRPRGEDADEARDWLEGYERKRNNWVGVLALAEARPDADLSELADLREHAALQYLEAATHESNLALRVGMYKELSRIYPASRASRVAGELARLETEEATVQQIRLSRGFLLENSEVSGPRGLGLRPELLDGNPANAELHPEGVTLVGSRFVRVSYLAPSGDDDEAPERVLEAIGQDHLARVVSLLEETSYRNMLVDPLDDVGVDARRDLFFERARLGLAAQTDGRAGAISDYAYRGVRERYGIVRHRESLLPFDLVLQGSLSTMSLGAFPRMRKPKETPDAFLHR